MGEWITRTLVAGGYGGVLLLTLLETVFPPVPSELILPLAGYLVSRGELLMMGVIVAGTLGAVAGATLLYWFGASLGERRLKSFADRHGRWLTLSSEDIDRAGAWFDRHGSSAVFFGRMVPGLRSFISLPAGIRRMPLPAFLAWTTLGSAAWTTALVVIGNALGRNFAQVGGYVDPVAKLVLGAVLLLYAWRVLRHKGAGAPRAEVD